MGVKSVVALDGQVRCFVDTVPRPYVTRDDGGRPRINGPGFASVLGMQSGFSDLLVSLAEMAPAGHPAFMAVSCIGAMKQDKPKSELLTCRSTRSCATPVVPHQDLRRTAVADWLSASVRQSCLRTLFVRDVVHCVEPTTDERISFQSSVRPAATQHGARNNCASCC